jgi:membrane protein
MTAIDLWRVMKSAVLSFVEDEALTRGAAIAFYSVTSSAPILLIVVAIAGLVVGREAAEQGIAAELTGLLGPQAAKLLEGAIANAWHYSGTWAAAVGVVTLIVAASGAFGEMQASLNAIWKTEPQGGSLPRLMRARAASLGLVVTLGFLMMVSLAASAALTALGHRITTLFPYGEALLAGINAVISFAVLSFLFAAVYKVLPDRALRWRDVLLGAFLTALLFVAGKSLIGWYIGSSAIASTYGAAGSLIVLLLWVYYSAQIFLLGAEMTKAFTEHRSGKRT